MKRKMLMFLCTLIFVVCTAIGFTACGDGTGNGGTGGNGGNTEQGGGNTQTPDDNQGDNTENEYEKVSGSEGLEYTLSDDGTFYYFSGLGTCTDTEITIANYYNGKPVKQIGMYTLNTMEEIEHLFENTSEEELMKLSMFANSNVKSVIISEGITTIGTYAFFGMEECHKIERIAIPDSVTYIAACAFAGCGTLTGKLVIPNGVTVICDGAFAYCSALTDIAIPDSVTSIGVDAFDSCSGLTSITIPDSVTSIGGYAFYGCSGLTSITLPDSVTSIGERAFYYCSGLTGVTIPDSVTYLGNLAFGVCDSLESITLPFIGPTIGDDGDYENITYAFTMDSQYGQSTCNSKSLKTVTISGGDIFKGAFFYNFYDFYGDLGYNIENVILGDGVKVIGEKAFSNPNEFDGYSANGFDVKSITLSKELKSIGAYAFQDCSFLTEIYYEGDIAGWCGISGLYNLMGRGSWYGRKLYVNGAEVSGNLVIPDGVTSIGVGAFAGCFGLTSVNVPDGVTSIGSYAFNNCRSLTSINVPDSVTSIGSYAFENCRSLTSINVPVGVTSIGSYAFFGCDLLTDITFNGTKAQWEAIEKEEHWDNGVGAYSDDCGYTVHCTDGDITESFIS